MAILLGYDLSTRIVHWGNVEERNGTLVVETPPTQWAYAVELPLSQRSLPNEVPFRVKLGVCVDNGCLGIGILSRDGRAFRHEIQVSATEGQFSEFEFVFTAIRTIGSLIIRNASETGAPSRGKCRILTGGGTSSD